MVGLLVVSHSGKAAAGIVEIAAEMASDVSLVAVGGDPDGGIGTDADAIAAGLDEADDGEGVVVLVDLGSATMNAELAVEMAETDAVLADAPVLEGTVNAAVHAAGSKATLDSTRDAAEEARGMSKL
ncbi:dihydroxyacetone kinase phosphotransfer subunit [Halarchaeum rubridurum]|uniref:phosphoenolpyruvate--glycerone phosphotransferase n=1 Tax=Halarchaeum rubridurum TaxID=489911 RepID=A0A830FJR6_9EURY|nr:dihydroxyacetone kinase phosphoryl donor subunit DhaM [Halarchaeum rubridurum]MBP1953702.1 dihydroxyacetone kinase phosphotransfer subunit [Halarchaeum rubridurum]GGM53998.1 PTS mannose transporter subunit IID [Halarchaeum rubridurum]